MNLYWSARSTCKWQHPKIPVPERGSFDESLPNGSFASVEMLTMKKLVFLCQSFIGFLT